jgi:hypothetical protein
MRFVDLILAAPALFVLSQMGCSSSGNGSSDATCSANNPIMPTCKALDYTTLDTTAVSFKGDVFTAIIRPTCNSSACHGVPLAQSTGVYPGAGLYLGPAASDNSTTVDATLLATIWGELQRSSATAPSMKIVAPTDPANSFLMLKLTGCQNTKSLTCMVQSVSASETKTGCGDSMPPSCFAQSSNVALSDAQIATFARWIAQGAQNN